MDTISVGVIHTYSSILPMSKLFDRALKKAFKKQSEIDVEVYPEFVNQGSLRLVEEAVSKMLNFHDVDVITGIVSSKVVMELSEKFKGRDVLFLPNNLGAHLLDPDKVPDKVFLNSPLLWQQIWSLGNWATKKYGSRAMFVGGVYDMAYAFTHMLDLGMRDVDPNCHWSFAVSHMPEEGETLSDPSVIFEYVEREMPDFLFAAFCGKEASLFLDEFIERGLHKKIPLITTPYLLEDYSRQLAEPLTVYTTLSANKPLTDADLEKEWTSIQGLFTSLGRESAQMILKATAEGTAALNQPFETERGTVHIHPEHQGVGARVYIVENRHPGSKAAIQKKLLEEVKTIDINAKEVREGMKLTETAWLNPYLGV